MRIVTYDEKLVKLDIAVGVVGHLEQWLEHIGEELLEIVHHFVWLEDVAVELLDLVKNVVTKIIQYISLMVKSPLCWKSVAEQ